MIPYSAHGPRPNAGAPPDRTEPRTQEGRWWGQGLDLLGKNLGAVPKGTLAAPLAGEQEHAAVEVAVVEPQLEPEQPLPEVFVYVKVGFDGHAGEEALEAVSPPLDNLQVVAFPPAHVLQGAPQPAATVEGTEQDALHVVKGLHERLGHLLVAGNPCQFLKC